MIDTSHFDKCREIMHKHQKHHWQRFIVLLLMLVSNLFVQILEYANMMQNYVGFHMGMATIMASVIVLVCGLMATPERPAFLGALLVMLTLGAWQQLFGLTVTIPVMLVYLLEIPECSKARWVMQQEGYPYFNERFEMQVRRRAIYRPDYELDGKEEAVMQDADDETPPEQLDDDALIRQMQERLRRKQERERREAREASEARKRYAVQPGKTKDTMPEILLKTPEEAAAEKAPPVQETVSDPVTDTSVVLSDFPEIAGDIPDLPDIPDIPKL